MPRTREPQIDVDEVRRRFPAKFSKPILDALEDELRGRLAGAGVILDPFAGVGGIHALAERLPALNTIGVELEPEFAACHDRTVCGDSATLTAPGSPARAGVDELLDGRPLDAIVTSPAYGNRLADQYLGSANEKCRKCDGAGQRGEGAVGSLIPCSRCGGTGKAPSDRQGYAIAKGAKLSPGNGAAAGFGARYHDLHQRVMADVAKFVSGQPVWWLVNVSSFIRDETYVGTMEWWVGEVARHAEVVALRPIATARHGHGANRDSRVHAEHLIIARTA